MLEQGKISTNEFQILVITFVIGSAILIGPAPLAEAAKQDAWISAVIVAICSLMFVFIFNKLTSVYPSMTFVQLNEKIFGKWIGRITSLLFLAYTLHIASAQVSEIGEFFSTQILVETPSVMIMILFVFTSLIGVHSGIEVISRSALIFFPWIMLLLLILFLFLIPEVKLENIQPILGGGIKPIMKGVYFHFGLAAELGILLMITPYVNNKIAMKKAFYKGASIGGCIIFLIVLFSVLVLGANLTANQAYPSYILGKMISIGNFIERIEVIVAIIWFITLFLKLTICYYGLSIGLAQMMRLKDYKPLLYPLAILIISFALIMHPDIVHLHQFLKTTFTPYSSTFCILLPLALLMVGKIKK